MFERFTDRARRVLVHAQDEARLLEHNYIGTEHILLGLLAEGENETGSEGLGGKALASFGITLKAARENVATTVGPAVTTSERGSPPFTPRSKKVLELSLREALRMGHNYIGTEHILLGLVREGEGLGAQVIVNLGVELGALRQRVFELIAATNPPGGRSAETEMSRARRGAASLASLGGPAAGVSPLCRCGADLVEAVRYRTIEVPAAPGEAGQGTLVTTVVYCRHCGYVLGTPAGAAH